MSESVKIVLTKAKETKGTYVYSNPDAVVPSVYVKKDAFPDGAPAKLEMTLTPVDKQ